MALILQCKEVIVNVQKCCNMCQKLQNLWHNIPIIPPRLVPNNFSYKDKDRIRHFEIWLVLPTFLDFCPHISQSKNLKIEIEILRLKNYGMVPKKILWPRHMYKWYILKKNWQKSVNSTLSTGEKKVPVGIWGCHHQLDNHHKLPMVNTKIIYMGI